MTVHRHGATKSELKKAREGAVFDLGKISGGLLKVHDFMAAGLIIDAAGKLIDLMEAEK